VSNDNWKKQKHRKKRKYKIVDYKDGKFHIQFKNHTRDEFSDLLSMVKLLEGSWWNKDTQKWLADPSENNIRTLRGYRFSFVGNALSLLNPVKTEPLKPLPYKKVDRTLLKDFRPSQIQAVEFLEGRNGRGIIGDPMGFGKTAEALGYLKIHPELRPVLIVCPASLKLKWGKEIQTWIGPEETVEILSGTTIYGAEKNSIYIINYDILQYWSKALMDIRWKAIIGDEIHKLVTTSARRSDHFIAVARKVQRRIFLSGTLLTKYIRGMYLPLHLTIPHVFGNEHKFKMRYCGPSNDGYGWKFNGVSNEEELRSIYAPYVIRRGTEELPGKVRSVIPMEISNGGEYKEAEDILREYTQSDKVPDREEIENIWSKVYAVKRNAIISWVENFLESGEKLALFAYHKWVIKDLMDVFGRKAVKIDGSVSSEKRQAIVKRFHSDDKLRLFIGQIQAAGEGIDILVTPYTAMVELCWIPGMISQVEDRTRRRNQKAETVFTYYLLAENTIEEDMLNDIEEGLRLINYMMDGKKETENFNRDSDMHARVWQRYQTRIREEKN
jgi:SWI/SNF-related matrix-associated actin-dependent regulator 1 of chromatin subfamily A